MKRASGRRAPNIASGINGNWRWHTTNVVPLKDRSGRIAGFQGTSRDITIRKQSEVELSAQSRMRQLLLDVSSTYINLPSDEFETAIQDSLRHLASHIDADRGYIFRYDFDRGICTNTHEWCGEGFPPQIDELQVVPLNDATDWVKTHRRGEAICIPDVPALPQGVLRDKLEPQGIKSLISIPLMSGRDCIGFIGFESVLRHHAYSDSERDLLTVFGRLLVNIHLRRQAEESMKKSEKKHRLLIENSYDIIYTLSADGLLNFVSPAWTDLLGHPVSLVAGRHFREFLHPDDLAKYEIFLRSVIETGQRYEGITYRLRHLDGTWRWHTSNGIAIEDESGAIIGFQGIARDVTAQKQAEEELRTEKARLLAITESAHDAILMINPEGDVSFWNPAAERIFGYASDEAIGQNLHLLLAPQSYHASHQEAFGRFRTTGQGAAVGKTLELEARHKEGREIPVELSLSALELPNGWNAVGIMRDITARKQSEAAVRDSQRRLEDIIEFLPDATMVIDREGRVIAWNRAIETLTGVRKEDIIGKGNYEYALPFYGERRPVLIDLALHPRPEMEPAYLGIYRREGVLFGESYTPSLPGGNLYLSGRPPSRGTQRVRSLPP